MLKILMPNEAEFLSKLHKLDWKYHRKNNSQLYILDTIITIDDAIDKMPFLSYIYDSVSRIVFGFYLSPDLLLPSVVEKEYPGHIWHYYPGDTIVKSDYNEVNAEDYKYVFEH